jgi:CheY-like chemotaxis protein
LRHPRAGVTGFDLIFTDLLMPVVDGLTRLRTVKAQTPGVSVDRAADANLSDQRA